MRDIRKKGSLQLSVNAIVVFVLAFAMLSVGFFLVNMIRGQLNDTVPQVFKLDNFQVQPDAQNPLVFTPNEIRADANGEVTMGVAFFNKLSNQLTNARFDIIECLVPGSGVPNDIVKNDGNGNLLTIRTLPQDVDIGEIVTYTIAIVHEGTSTSKLNANSQYVCSVGVTADDYPLDKPAHKEQVQIIVES